MSTKFLNNIFSPITLAAVSAVAVGGIWGFLESQYVEPQAQPSLVLEEPRQSVATETNSSSQVVSKPDVSSLKDEHQRSNDKDEVLAALTARIDSLASKNLELEEKLLALTDSRETVAQEDLAAAGLPEPSIPFSPEALERETRLQNEYIDSVEAAFHNQEENGAWASEVETLAMEKLMTGENAISEKAQKISGIALENFNCKSHLCNSVFVADSLPQLIEYQKHIIKEMVYDLPSVVFGPAESFGNGYRMRVMLASDDYEFPAMPTL